jgi:hypothetical protein
MKLPSPERAGRLTKKKTRARSGIRSRRRPEPTHAAATANLHAQARASWNDLDRSDQEALLHELVHTRGDDLRRAYGDIIAVGYGLQTKNTPKGKRRRSVDLAVKFMVKKKWGKHSRLSRTRRALPRVLLAYWRTPRGRQLINVPTDIDEVRAYRACRPQAGPRWVIASTSASTFSESGSITCVVRIPGDQQNFYVISAAHVFDLTEHYWPGLPSNVTLSESSSGGTIGQVTDFVGPLRSADQGLSFDAALAKVTDVSALAAAMGTLIPKRAIISAADIPASFSISTVNGTLSATKATVWTNQVLQYNLESGATLAIQHQTLVESDAATVEGDSGSPAITNDGTTLVGMNIYGGEGVAFLIPAYDLLATHNYSGLPAGQALSLVTDLSATN